MYKDYDYYFNYALVGPAGVGKSSIIERYVHDAFDFKTQTTIGYDFTIKQLSVNGEVAKLQIYDTAGQQRYRAIASSYLKNAHAVFLVYNVNDKRSLEQLKKVWLGMVEDQLKEGGIIVVLANKCDQDSVGPVIQDLQFLKEKNIKWVKTSAKTGLNIKQLMKNVTIELIKKHKPPKIQESKPVRLTSSQFVITPEKKNCCS